MIQVLVEITSIETCGADVNLYNIHIIMNIQRYYGMPRKTYEVKAVKKYNSTTSHSETSRRNGSYSDF